MYKYPSSITLSGITVILPNTRTYSLAIVYPYVISNSFITPDKYKVGSAAIGVIPYYQGIKGRATDMKLAIQFESSVIYSNEKGKGN